MVSGPVCRWTDDCKSSQAIVIFTGSKLVKD